MKVRLVLSCIALLFTAATVKALPIKYVVTNTASGTLGGSFTNQLVTITLVGDTDNVTASGGDFFNNGTYSTVSIGGGPDVLFTELLRFFASPGGPGVGIGDTDADILDTFSTNFATYDGTTSIGPITGARLYNQGHVFSTAAGSFLLTTSGGNSTFTATVISATPEPGSIVLVGTGLLGTLVMIRRRFAV